MLKQKNAKGNNAREVLSIALAIFSILLFLMPSCSEPSSKTALLALVAL